MSRLKQAATEIRIVLMVRCFMPQLEVYEASDETQVAALIEELTRGLDQGQFNLSRSGTLSNSTFTKKQQRA